MPPAYHEAAAAARAVACTSTSPTLAAAQAVGEHGLVALDWHSGNRSVLVDHELSGLVVGQTLATRPEDVYRALLEATAFGTRIIVEAFGDAGVPVDGVRRRRRPAEEPAADADLRRRAPACRSRSSAPSRARRSGSAIHAAVAAGAYPDVPRGRRGDGQARPRPSTCPIPAHVEAYDALFAEYRALHDHFGRGGNDVMHRLRPSARAAQAARDGRGRDVTRRMTAIADVAIAASLRARSPRCTPS